jgi:DNA-binding CsgD family transcriptional regulator
MATGRSGAQARIEAIRASTSDPGPYRHQALEVLRTGVDFDAYVWLLTDPVSAVGAAPLADVPCLPELPALIKSKYATRPHRWTGLQRGPSPVGRLADPASGGLSGAVVWRQVMGRYGVSDVASVVFADQFGCWGFLDLWLIDSPTPFSAADAAWLTGLAPALTAGLRHCQSLTFVEPALTDRPDLGPVVLTLDDDLRITSRTAVSQRWLERLLPPRAGESAVPASVYNVAAQLLAVEAGVDDHPPVARVHLADGFWLTLRAARLADEGSADSDVERPTSGLIAVTIEETSAADRLELFGRVFGLTVREEELLQLLAVGSDTRGLARRMSLSEHTVQDHLKSIFAKTGAHDRITLLSRALGTRGDRPAGP